MSASSDPRTSGRIAFTYPDFLRYQIARFSIVTSLEMLSVAVGWQVYDITHRALDLGFVGLAQFLPGIFLFLPAGHAADRFNRRNLMILCYIGFAICSGLLLIVSITNPSRVYPIYLVLVLLGVVRSFNGPVSRALLPQLVSSEHFPNAVAWNSSIFQTATILGPALGGLLYAFARHPYLVYATAFLVSLAAVFSTFQIKLRTKAPPREKVNWTTVLAGFHYIWRHKIILGSISLDMFAVLLGGSVALLPVYAREILHTGPWGLGILRSAPGIGAAMMAVLIAHRPLQKHVGATMLWCVAGFGASTIVFALSRNIVISLVALLMVGATDMVSVVIRGTLVQLGTPDHMRGRVNAVDMLFIGVSNEFGEFESGLTAHWFGAVTAAALGGIGTLIVIAIWAGIFPELRKAEKISSVEV
jgi:MFS family permease